MPTDLQGVQQAAGGVLCRHQRPRRVVDGHERGVLRDRLHATREQPCQHTAEAVSWGTNFALSWTRGSTALLR
jgi:hypothetical protein